LRQQYTAAYGGAPAVSTKCVCITPKGAKARPELFDNFMRIILPSAGKKTSIQKRDNVFELKLFDPIFFSKKIGGEWGGAP